MPAAKPFDHSLPPVTIELWRALEAALEPTDAVNAARLVQRLAESRYVHPRLGVYPRTALPPMIVEATDGAWSMRIAMPALNLDWIERLCASYGNGLGQRVRDLHELTYAEHFTRILPRAVRAPAVVERIGRYEAVADERRIVPGDTVATFELYRLERR